MENNNVDKYRCGMVSIIGRPNVGKSTLLNNIVGEKVAIVSRVPQTTRNRIRGLYNDDRGQIIFIDTPGLHLGKDQLDKCMNKSSYGTMKDVDCLIYLVDTTRVVGKEEENIVSKLKSIKVPIILALNKVDSKKGNVQPYISLWEEAKNKPITQIQNFTLIALSGKTGINIDKLIDILFGYLPEGPALYPTDIVCDVPQKMVISDIIREKLFRSMRDEIPHSTGVVIEEVKKVRGKTLNIKACVFVERNAHKQIVIGKNGSNLKKIGSSARIELEELLETKVFLDIYVKAQKGWRENLSLLQEMGYQE